MSTFDLSRPYDAVKRVCKQNVHSLVDMRTINQSGEEEQDSEKILKESFNITIILINANFMTN